MSALWLVSMTTGLAVTPLAVNNKVVDKVPKSKFSARSIALDPGKVAALRGSAGTADENGWSSARPR